MIRKLSGAALLIGGLLPAVAFGQSPEESSGVSADSARRRVEVLLASFEHEPSVREVQRAALERAGLDPNRPKHWDRRARLANLVPDLQGEIGWRNKTDRSRKYSEDFEFHDSRGMSRDNADHKFAADTKSRIGYSIEAELELGGLVFDRDEIYAARERREQAAARRRIVAKVSRLYFERRKKQILRMITPHREWRKRLELGLAIERLTARLDGLTGGWFRRRLDNTNSNSERSVE